ncbi:hypothetical protein ACLB2K_050857 [Fragaria x ananassa]
MADSSFLDEAKELFKPLSGEVTLPQVAVFTMVISTYARAGMAMDAHKVYQQMLASGVTPTAYTYTALISGFAIDLSNLDSLGYAKKYFLEKLDRGMKPHYKPYMDLMNAIACEEPEEEANKFLEQIKAKGLTLDDYIQRKPPDKTDGGNPHRALQGDKGYEEECKEVLEVMISKGFVPNAKAMREGDKGSEEECKELVGVMISKGFVSNAKAMRDVLRADRHLLFEGS